MNNIESDYDCASASEDLHALIAERDALGASADLSDDDRETLNRLENQIRFIRNKCDIH